MQGSVIRDGHKREVRFGSLDYAIALLRAAEAKAVRKSAKHLMRESVVSLLVDVPEKCRLEAITPTNGSAAPQAVVR